MQFPGWTNAWTMPIKTRVDMLTTGIRTPIGIKVFGTDLDEIERVGDALEHAAGADPRDAQRALRAQPRRALPRHRPQPRRAGALRPARRRRRARHRERDRRRADQHDDRGAQPLLDQRALPAGPAQRHRVAAPVLVPIGGDSAGGSMGGSGAAPMGRRAPWRRHQRTAFASADALGWPHPIFLAQNMGSMGGGVAPSGGTGTLRPRLPERPELRDRTCRPAGSCEPRR